VSNDTKLDTIWLENEENIGKCSMIGICLVMNSSTISYVRGLSFVNMFGSLGYRLGGLRFKKRVNEQMKKSSKPITSSFLL
jgi:hypothetical protein